MVYFKLNADGTFQSANKQKDGFLNFDLLTQSKIKDYIYTELLTTGKYAPKYIKLDNDVYIADISKIEIDNLYIAREDKKEELANAFNVESIKQVKVNEVFYNGGYDSALKLDSAKRMSELAGLDKASFFDIENKEQVLSLANATTVILTIGAKYQQDFGKYQSLKTQIEISTLEELESIVW